MFCTKHYQKRYFSWTYCIFTYNECLATNFWHLSQFCYSLILRLFPARIKVLGLICLLACVLYSYLTKRHKGRLVVWHWILLPCCTTTLHTTRRFSTTPRDACGTVSMTATSARWSAFCVIDKSCWKQDWYCRQYTHLQLHSEIWMGPLPAFFLFLPLHLFCPFPFPLHFWSTCRESGRVVCFHREPGWQAYLWCIWTKLLKNAFCRIGVATLFF